MERTRTFTWVGSDQDESGIAGWRPLDNPYFDPVLSFGVAHDVLEHMDNMPGMDAEMQALGVLYYGRVRMGYFDDGARQAHLAIVSDILTFYDNGAEDPSPIEPRPLTEDECEDVQHMETLLSEFGVELAVQLSGSESFEDRPEEIEEVVGYVIDHMRNGMRRAQKEYGNPNFLYEAFNEVANNFAVGGICYHDYFEQFEQHDTLTITVDPKMRRVSIEVHHAREDELLAELEGEDE